jgi:hypothetical protein
MKKLSLLAVACLALAFTSLASAQTVRASTTYTETGVTAANLPAAMATLSSETTAPSGSSFASLSAFKNPTTGLFTVTAQYR